MANRENVKNILLTVLLTSIVVVALIATTTALSLRSGVTTGNSAVTPVTPGYQAALLPDSESGLVPTPPPVVGPSVTSDAFQSALPPGSDEAKDEYYLKHIQRDMASDWFIDRYVTVSGYTASVESPAHAYAFAQMVLPSVLFGPRWVPFVDLERTHASWQFRADNQNTLGSVDKIGLSIFDGYGTRFSASTLELKDPSCGADTAADVKVATSLLLEYYGQSVGAVADPCLLVSKVPIALQKANWWAKDVAERAPIALYVLNFQSKPVDSDRAPAQRYFDYHPAVIMRAGSDTEELKGYIKSGRYNLIETDILVSTATPVTDMTTLVDSIYTSLGKSTVNIECGYEYCF